MTNVMKARSDPHRLKSQIKQKFKLYDQKKQYSFDQILFILDQECDFQKCDRDVARQLFDQSINANGKACLDQIIFRYVENLQTSQLCLTRQQRAAQTLQQKLGSIKANKKTYAHIKIIQITTHARHSSMPSLTYKIEPSDIPPVTVVNSISPVLNHEYTLQLETNNFSIIFYESGVKICQWTWPDSPGSVDDGEYYRNIMGENLSFEIKINYKPKDSHPDRKVYFQDLQDKERRIKLQKQALHKLYNFQPFLQKTKTHRQYQPTGFVAKLFACLPLLRKHIRNLYYSLILLIIIECLASLSWPMQFLDITVAFGIIGTLYDQSQADLGMEMLVCILSFAILIAKSIWGFVVHNQNQLHWVALLVISIVMKAVCIFLAWIVSACKEGVPKERQQTFYDDVEPITASRSRIDY